MGPIIAILGAESTGKTTLAAALAQALRERGREAVVVREYLREFCDERDCTPQRHEQEAIAAEQWRRIEAAGRDGAVVVADTTPLMIAVYSDYIFGDGSLYAGALERQGRCAHTLLTGLDLPWRPDGLQRDGPQVRGPVDVLIRAALASAALPHAVIYGRGAARTAAALRALRPLLGGAADAGATSGGGQAGEAGARLRPRCSECLVPGCEHLGLLPPIERDMTTELGTPATPSTSP